MQLLDSIQFYNIIYWTTTPSLVLPEGKGMYNVVIKCENTLPLSTVLKYVCTNYLSFPS